jgi:hypothetical protein
MCWILRDIVRDDRIESFDNISVLDIQIMKSGLSDSNKKRRVTNVRN